MEAEDRETTQEEVVEFLKAPANHTDGSDTVRHVTTHVAHVFLTESRAWKMKRAVAYSFLDFTDIEAREEVCRREIELNRRTAPEIYLDVHSITRRADGGLEFDGDGPVMEWVIEMRRFDEDQMFDHLIEKGQLTREHVVELVDRVYDLHEKAERLSEPFGGAAGLGSVIEENAQDMQALSGTFSPEAVADLTSRSREGLAGVAGLLDRRRADGWVRQCHGDLHLGNVVLWQGQATPFDCIEFSQRIAGIDVVYDLAYLLMDLVNRGRPDLANLAMNRYFGRMGQPQVLEALPLMLSVRAAIRAKVTAAAVEGQDDPAEAEKLAADAQGFFALALEFLRPAEMPRLIAVGGFSGTGKSTLAARLAPDLGRAPGALQLRSDVIRKRLNGVAPETRLSADAYSAGMNEQVYETLFSEAETALKAGHSVIADAVWARPEERSRLQAVADAAGATFQGAWLEASRETLEARVQARRNDSSDADVAVLEKQLTYDPGTIDWLRLEADAGAEAVLEAARDQLDIPVGGT
ncbi:AAA family ATPase [Fodinicurvata fenggangensis]|uniref:bifunctional aminoglycoside phosphotransferase/ATP-binding protein n=1 Tax=Fodinicurvata fenggangensis TaxID=1121830 RepID=UPI00047A1740|nr:bifunctional aminoglycoside phosphotransferase/ATP-binding protein [Fodinicurvata fenggangensis]